MVSGQFLPVLIIQGRAVGKQAIDQERLRETHRVLVDTHRIDDTEVERTYFDVFDASAPQRRRWPLARPGNALRADGTVVLIFDLQLVQAELLVFAINQQTVFFVVRLASIDSRTQTIDVIIQVIQ